MSRRSGFASLALLAVTPAALLAQTFSYSPGASQYRVTSQVRGAQEVMGQRQEFETSSDQLVSVSIARAGGDTLTVTSTLDSLSIVGPMGMTPPGLDKLKGLKVVSQVSPVGAVYSFKGPGADSIPNADQVVDEMSQVLPVLRPNLGPRVTWTDTSSRKVSQGGVDIDRKVVATYTVEGDTTVGGQKGWKISRKANTALSGSGSQGGQPLTLEGTSLGTGTMVVTPAGSFLGMSSEEQMSIKVLLAANGMEVGVSQTATTRVEKVR